MVIEWLGIAVPGVVMAYLTVLNGIWVVKNHHRFCPACVGTGVAGAFTDCPDCRGSGVI